MPDQYVHVTFRIIGAALDPDQVSSQLNLLPSSAHRKGDPLPGRPTVQRSAGFWGLDSAAADTEPLETRLRVLLDVLTPKRSEIQRLVSLDYSPELYCSVTMGDDHGTIDLGAQILARIGDLPARLVIALYGPVEEPFGD